MYVFLHLFVSTLSALLQASPEANPSVHECIYTRLWNPCYHWLSEVLKKIHFFASILAWFYTFLRCLAPGRNLVGLDLMQSQVQNYACFFAPFSAIRIGSEFDHDLPVAPRMFHVKPCLLPLLPQIVFYLWMVLTLCVAEYLIYFLLFLQLDHYH